jgi:hypothetical protein
MRDVDFHGKSFLLRRQVTRGRIESTKTGKARRIDMSDAVAAELLAMKKKRQAEYLAKGRIDEFLEWVVPATELHNTLASLETPDTD